ncbi:hypothetical protein IFR05_017545, partial [Cadophora sp. M221]
SDRPLADKAAVNFTYTKPKMLCCYISNKEDCTIHHSGFFVAGATVLVVCIRKSHYIRRVTRHNFGTCVREFRLNFDNAQTIWAFYQATY